MHESEEIATQPYPQQWLRREMKALWLAILNHRREKRGIPHDSIATPHTL